MPTILNVSEAASLAMHAAVLLAVTPDSPLPTRQIASALQASPAHLSKVLQRMGRAGLVESRPGPKGGFRLARSAGSITLLQLYECIEGPLAPNECLFATPVCRRHACILGELLGSVNSQVSQYLARTALSDLIEVRSEGSC